MTIFNVRIGDEQARRFDAWAADHGGRSGALRRFIVEASGGPAGDLPAGRRGAQPVKLTVRLSARDGAGIGAEAAPIGLSRNAWAAAVLRRRLAGRPTFPPRQEAALIAMQAELRRIGVNVNQIARAMNVAVGEGQVLDLEMAYLDALRRELAAHMLALREAFDGNLAYWAGEP